MPLWGATKHENGTVKGLFRHGSGITPDTGITRINHFISQDGFNRVIREIRAKNLFSN